VDGMRLTDVQFMPQPVTVSSVDQQANMTLPGTFQMLYYDMEGNLRTAAQKWEDSLTVPMGDGCRMEATLWPMGKPQGSMLSGSIQLSGEGKLLTETVSANGIPMVAGLELGELQEADPRRPSLILRRADGQSLWELAKECGSSVESIREANGLQTEPEIMQMLLIPIL